MVSSGESEKVLSAIETKKQMQRFGSHHPVLSFEPKMLMCYQAICCPERVHAWKQ